MVHRSDSKVTFDTTTASRQTFPLPKKSYNLHFYMTQIPRHYLPVINCPQHRNILYFTELPTESHGKYIMTNSSHRQGSTLFPKNFFHGFLSDL